MRGIIRWRVLGVSLGEGDNQMETDGSYHGVRGIIRWRLLGIRRSMEERGEEVV